MLAQSFRSDPKLLEVLAETPQEIEAERQRRQAAKEREREIQEARMEARAAAQAEMGLVHLVSSRVDQAVHRRAARQRTFAARRRGPPLIRSREAERAQKRRSEGDDLQAAPSAHVAMQYRDQEPRKRRRLRVTEAAPKAPPRKRLRRKTAPVETPEARRRRLNRERVNRCRVKRKPQAKAKPRVKRTKAQMQEAALAGVQARRLRQEAAMASAQVQEAASAARDAMRLRRSDSWESM